MLVASPKGGRTPLRARTPKAALGYSGGQQGLSGRIGSPKGALVGGSDWRDDRPDPFSAYLSWRPTTGHTGLEDTKDLSVGSTGCGPLNLSCRSPSVPVTYFGRVPNPKDDPFATFNTVRPPVAPTA